MIRLGRLRFFFRESWEWKVEHVNCFCCRYNAYLWCFGIEIDSGDTNAYE